MTTDTGEALHGLADARARDRRPVPACAWRSATRRRRGRDVQPAAAGRGNWHVLHVRVPIGARTIDGGHRGASSSGALLFRRRKSRGTIDGKLDV